MSRRGSTGLHLPGTLTGGGGGGGAALVRAGDPADVGLSAGSTSSSGTARTFSAPSGGTGSPSLVVTIDQAVGSGASLAGDNSSGWYVANLSNGDVVKVLGTWTDGASQAVVDSFVVSVSVAAGAAFVLTSTIDLTALTPTTLVQGSQVVDGVTIECEDAGETLSANGLSAADTKDVFVDISSAFTGQENPKLVVLKTVMPAGWGGVNTGHAVRARIYSAGLSAVGTSPSFQGRFYPLSSGAMRMNLQWQHRYPTSTGSFSSSSSFDHSAASAVTTWYTHLAAIRGTYFCWIAQAPSIPADLSDLLTPSASHIVAAVNAYSAIGTGDFWPASGVFAGLYNQSSASLAYLAEIKAYEYR